MALKATIFKAQIGIADMDRGVYGDFALTMARQLFYSAFAAPFFAALASSNDTDIAGIAAKAAKECEYHLRHASEWVIRLGDGTDESHTRMQAGIDELWMYTGELFEIDTALRPNGNSGLLVTRFEAYAKDHPEQAKEFARRMAGELPMKPR